MNSELHVWRLRLDVAEDEAARLAALLSADERERAERFKFDRDRRRYIAARGQLRKLLAGYLGVEAGAVAFDYGPYGKPRLRGEAGGLEFNLAHSGEAAAVAVAWGRAVGVDVEQHRFSLDLDSIARRYFAPGEVRRWLEMPEDERSAAFFQCWTRKEAYLKAHGAGLSLELDSFEVSFGPGTAPRLLWTQDGTEHGWELLDVEMPEGYAGAAAVQRVEGRGVGRVMVRGA